MASLVVTASAGTAGQSLLHVRGELDYATGDTLRTPALEALDTASCTELSLDFADVTFLDSSGLGVLVEIRNAARNRNVAMTLVNVPTAVRRIIEIGGLTAVLGVTPAASAT